MDIDNNKDRHYSGIFCVDGEEINGDLIYNKESGVILLNLVKQLPDNRPIGRSYSNLNIISGILNTGTRVTLFHNRCIKNHTQEFLLQQLYFKAEYLIWSKCDAANMKYNKFVCILENALAWSGLSVIETSGISTIKFKDTENKDTYHWFGAKITFSTSLNCELFNYPHKEESKVIERLIVSIEADEKQGIPYFVAVRNKIIALISFAIKDNVNIEEQYLFDYSDSYQIGDQTEYGKHYLLTSEQRLHIQNRNLWEYNFTLNQIAAEKDIQDELNLLEPVFNLYLSLFKHTNMPIEMVFLNIVQALETLHARFFYDDDKDKYVESVVKRFGSCQDYPAIEKLLLNDTQKDVNCKYIILVSRLNDLLIGKYDGLFYDYYANDIGFAQSVADTRHYFTHYGKSKEKKALKGDKLIDAIRILSLLLEYYVCLQLGIDNQAKVRERLSSISAWQQFQNENDK